MSKEEILKKIQKLLAMSTANGASENEAMMAAQKVQELLKEHNLSLGDIKDNEQIEPINQDTFDVERDIWKSWIRATTAKLYFCTTYTTNRMNEKYQRVKCVTFVGRESNRAVAKSMCDYFINAVERMADKEFENVPGSKSDINRMKHNFKQGCASSLSDRIRKKYNEINGPDIYSGLDNPNGLPILYKNEETSNRNWLAKQGIKLRSSNSNVRIKDRVAFGRGKEKGNDIGLDTQINANRGRYLTA